MYEDATPRPSLPMAGRLRITSAITSGNCSAREAAEMFKILIGSVVREEVYDPSAISDQPEI
jgi:predicted metal-binding protein